MYNISGQNDTAKARARLAEIKTELRKLPLNATDMLQPADSFAISNIKDA